MINERKKTDNFFPGKNDLKVGKANKTKGKKKWILFSDVIKGKRLSVCTASIQYLLFTFKM